VTLKTGSWVAFQKPIYWKQVIGIMNKKPLRVGVIGVGTMGLHHARNYAELANADLVAVADTDMSRANTVAARFGCRAFNDYREMLSNEHLDAVSVVVPTELHYTVAMDTLRAHVHTLVEKPIARSLEQASELIEAGHTYGVKLAVGHVERFNPAVQELKRRLKTGELGTISSMIARRVGVMPPRIKDVDVILDLAVHDIDVVMYLLDQEPSEVAACAGSALLSHNRSDHSEIFLRFGNIGCFIQANWITPIKIRTLSVTGDAGHAELNYITQRLEIFQSTLDRHFDNFGDFVVRFGTPQTIAVDTTPQEPLRLELKSFLNAIEGQDSVIVTGEEGARTLAVAERVKAMSLGIHQTEH
jgi:UDP-N-acetylglucosamine 3-dehydrogenase